MNDYIGTRTDQGVVWPLFTIHGNTYDKQLATVLNFDSRQFAVVGFGEVIDPEKIRALKESIQTPPAPIMPLLPKKEAKGGKDENLPDS